MSEFLHPNLSPWGYTYDAETLPNFLTAQEFSNYTNGKFGTTDTRIASNITSATAAIRNYCGWHISPSLTCGMLYNVHDLRDAFVGPDLLIQLPATFVSGVTKIVLGAKWNTEADDWDGEIITDPDRFDVQQGGLLRVYDVGYLDRKAKLFVKYQAGLPDTNIAVIKELTANKVTHAVTNAYGVTSEAAGGVSVTYNSTWSGRSSSTTLADDSREVLNAYKVKGVY